MGEEKEGERLRQKQLAWLEQKIDRGISQLERSEGISGDEARAHFRLKPKAQKRTPGTWTAGRS
jgi:hypothetical protein